MPTHYNLKADFTCVFCAKTKQYSAMLVNNQIEPSIMNSDIREFYLNISASSGEIEANLTTPTGKCLALVCKECSDIIGTTLSNLLKERRNKVTG